jgi:Phospholipase A2-like domain
MKKKGRGIFSTISEFGGKLLNKAIDLLPVEVHLKDYQYCGPGTNLRIRLARNDPGINKLDRACKRHDIAYSQEGGDRTAADRRLADEAWERVSASDASLNEKAAAWAITNIMKLKSKLGGGGGRRQQRRRRRPQGKGLYMRNFKAGTGLKRKRNASKKKKVCRRRR